MTMGDFLRRHGGWRAIACAIGLSALQPAAAVAKPTLLPLGLYGARAIVTGTDNRQRHQGFDRCLRDVLVKVSGDPALHDDPRVAAFAPSPERLAEDFDYQDRMSDIPLHDEQGTRDRPYDLAVRFAPAEIDALLARLGEKPWLATRPPLVLQITVTRDGSRFPLAADDVGDEWMREAAIAAGDQYGMRVVLPPKTALSAFPPVPDAIALRGTLTWSEQALGWIGDWHLVHAGRDHAWGIRGVSFDEAFRDAVRGAMQLLAGKGEPRG
jgi:hypothetical protein